MNLVSHIESLRRHLSRINHQPFFSLPLFSSCKRNVASVGGGRPGNPIVLPDEFNGGSRAVIPRAPKNQLYSRSILSAVALKLLIRDGKVIGEDTQEIPGFPRTNIYRFFVDSISKESNEYLPEGSFTVVVDSSTKSIAEEVEVSSLDGDNATMKKFVLKCNGGCLVVSREEFEDTVWEVISNKSQQERFFKAGTKPQTVQGVQNAFIKYFVRFVRASKEDVTSVIEKNPSSFQTIAQSLLDRVAQEEEFRAFGEKIRSETILSPKSCSHLRGVAEVSLQAVRACSKKNGTLLRDPGSLQEELIAMAENIKSEGIHSEEDLLLARKVAEALIQATKKYAQGNEKMQELGGVYATDDKPVDYLVEPKEGRLRIAALKSELEDARNEAAASNSLHREAIDSLSAAQYELEAARRLI